VTTFQMIQLLYLLFTFLIIIAIFVSVIAFLFFRRAYRRYKETQESIRNKINLIESKIDLIERKFDLIESKFDAKLNFLNRDLQPLVNNFRRTQLREARRETLGEIGDSSYRDRSVIFLNNSYYHFFYLAQALRRRGWDAISVSYEDPINGPNVNFYHGEDYNLYSSDSRLMNQEIQELFKNAKQRFQLLHFAGDGLMSFFPEYYLSDQPPDIMEWKSIGKKVAYTISGCNSAVSQSSVSSWSAMDQEKNFCANCPWQEMPDICSDQKNLRWGKKVDQFCDLIFAEAYPALDYLDSPKVYFEPTSMCLDPGFWNSELHIPDAFKVERQAGELIVYHAVGNYELRTKEGRNAKGSSYVFEVIEQLKSEGMSVRLIFAKDLKNSEVRYLQLQSDVIVDQLYAGRYGANAREGMMLGKPVICYMNPYHRNPSRRALSLDECPLVSATSETLYDVLKDLLLDENKRKQLSFSGKEYALKWHSANRCAERYERVYDALMQGQLEQYITKTIS
jgi:hypothetical protein